MYVLLLQKVDEYKNMKTVMKLDFIVTIEQEQVTLDIHEQRTED